MGQKSSFRKPSNNQIFNPPEHKAVGSFKALGFRV